MKTNIIKALFGLILTFSISGLYAQSPRIKLNQIVKDTISGSVLISNLTDSNMVYSRNFYINAADTSLVFFGTTIVAGSGGGGSFVTLPQLTDSLALYATKVQLSDSMATVLKQVATDLTLTGDGTGASPLKVDTSVIATVSALRDSLAGIISSVSTDVTLTGDGSVGNPLKVDTTTYIATKGDLNLYYLASNPNGYTSDTGTVTSVAATAGTGISISGSPITGAGTLTITNTAPDQTVSITGAGINAVSGTYPNFTITGTEVDGSTTNELQTISYNSGTNTLSLSDGGGTADLSNLALVDSTRINATGDTALYYQNGVLIGTGAIAGGGGGSYNNISETVDTVYISDYLNVDTATLYVDASMNRVGILTASPAHTLHINRNVTNTSRALLIGDTPTYPDRNGIVDIGGTHEMNTNGTGFTFVPNLKNSNNSNAFYGYGINPNVDLQQNLFNYYNFLGINTMKTNGYTLTDLSNAFYRNDFFSSTGTVTNSVVVDIASPYFYTSAIKPTNNTGFRILNQGASGITTSYGLYIDSQSGATNSYPLYIGNFTSGTLSASSGIITASSDQRLKNEDGLVENGIEKINQLNPRYFYWKDQKMGINRQIGFYAQEVNAVIPEAAPIPNDGEYWGLYDRGLIAVSIKAIQEQQSIIESQATEIETLKTQIQLILNEIQILKNN